jgi:hypothetical protein
LHICNLSIRRLRQEDHEFKGSLGYIVSSRPGRSQQDCVSYKQNKQKPNNYPEEESLIEGRAKKSFSPNVYFLFYEKYGREL